MPESSETKAQQSTTSAKRLHALFVALSQLPNTTQKEALKKVLKVDEPNGNGAWAEVLCQQIVAEMLASFKRELAQANFDEDELRVHGRSFVPVCNALAPSRGNNSTNDIAQVVSPVVLNSLEHTDLILRKMVKETELVPQSFETLEQAVRDAQATLSASELPSELKDFLLSLLIQVELAIKQYRFRGIRGVEEALAGYYGGLGMARTEIGEKVDPHGKINLAKVLEKGQQVVTFAHKIAPFWPQIEAGAHHVKSLFERV